MTRTRTRGRAPIVLAAGQSVPTTLPEIPGYLAEWIGDGLAGDGSPIDAWASVTADSNWQVAATKTVRPTYRDNVLNGYGAAEFDGSNDIMNRNDVAAHDLSALTWIAVLNLANATDRGLFGKTGFWRIGTTDATHVTVGGSADADSLATETDLVTAGWVVLSVRLNATNAAMQANRNGSSATSADYGMGATTGDLQLGGILGFTDETQGQIAHHVLFDQYLSDANLEIAEDILATRYALSLP